MAETAFGTQERHLVRCNIDKTGPRRWCSVLMPDQETWRSTGIICSHDLLAVNRSRFTITIISILGRIMNNCYLTNARIKRICPESNAKWYEQWSKLIYWLSATNPWSSAVSGWWRRTLLSQRGTCNSRPSSSRRTRVSLSHSLTSVSDAHQEAPASVHLIDILSCTRLDVKFSGAFIVLHAPCRPFVWCPFYSMLCYNA